MPKHFGPHNMKNGYAAMGNHPSRPRHPGMSGRSVAESIAAERRKAAREAAARKNKK
jgi:hypothetical protein